METAFPESLGGDGKELVDRLQVLLVNLYPTKAKDRFLNLEVWMV